MPEDPGTTVRTVAAGVTRRTVPPYYDSPTLALLTQGVAGLTALRSHDLPTAAAELHPLGFTVSSGTDPVTRSAAFPAGRPYLMAVSPTGTAREWGLYLLDASVPVTVCIAVPHTRADEQCHELALRLWRAIPGALLMMATVHRDTTWAGQVKGTVADQAYNTESLFHHAWTDVFGPPGIPQVQIHGFADRRTGVQAVVSTGSARLTLPAIRIAEQLTRRGLVTTRSWDSSATELLATGNEQGRAAGVHGWAWVQVELNASVRTDPGPSPTLWETAMDAVRSADPALFRPRATPDPPVLNTLRNDHFRITLHGNRTLEAPTQVGAHRALVQVGASGITRTLNFGDSLHRAAGVPPSVRIAPGHWWYGDLVHAGPHIWLLQHSFTS
ncbi:MAG: hypothetical protein WAL50_02975 [Kineosporiaceae bacterium]